MTLGETPQVVTETVWALLSWPEPFIPSSNHLATTQSGCKLCQEQLIGTSLLRFRYGYAPKRPDQAYTAP
jgi:CRISPR-associated protein (TIGR02584 family)